MLTDAQIVFRLFIGAVLGGLVGIEREKHNKKIAGFRTHIIVCLGSVLVMLVSMHIFEIYGGRVQADPARIAAGVITGIGFLGAGTIMRSSESITGLTTAASLWTVAGIGLAVGCGFYVAAYATTVVVLVTLHVLNKLPFEKKRKKDRN